MNISEYINYWCTSIENENNDTNGNILFLRDLDNKDIGEIVNLSFLKDMYKDGMYTHTFSIADMAAPFEPFLSAIRHFYNKFYVHKMSEEKFIEECNVYSLQWEGFSTYLQYGYAIRKEPIVISEVNFEKNKVVQSILSCLEYIAKEHEIIILLNKIQHAPLSTLELIEKIIKNGIGPNIKIVIMVNDNEGTINYRLDKLDKILTKVEDQNIIFELEGQEQSATTVEYSNFVPNPDRLKEYNTIFNNYYHFLALDDMEYYLDIVHDKLVGDNIRIGNNVAFNFYFYNALCNLLRGNDNRATIMCEHLTDYYDKDTDLEKDFQYNYVSCKIHMSKNHNEIAVKYAKQCKNLAIKLKNKPFIFMAEVLYYSIEFGGWKNIFAVNFMAVTSSEEFIKKLKQYKFYNTLAYYLVYGFDNSESELEIIANGQTTKTYDEAFELIEKIGNTELLLSAYTKYIILLDTYGYHKALDSFYDKKLDVLKKEENMRRMANLYMGKGYNKSINEYFIEAHESFVKAVKILHTLRNSEQLGEAIYNMTLNCFGAEDFNTAKALMSLLFKILSNLGLKSIQVSSPAKLYALQALAYYKIGNDYRCFLCLKKIKKLVDLRTGNKADSMYVSNNPHEDLFLYYLISGILDKNNGKIKNAVEKLETANKMYEKVAGCVFYAFTILVTEYYEALVMDGQNEKANEIIDAAVAECKKNNFNVKLQNIQAHINNKPVISEDFSNAFSQPEIENIISLSKDIGIAKQLNKQKKNIWFLSSWQEMLNNDYLKHDKMVNESINMIQDNFYFEEMLYVDVENGIPKVSFSNIQIDGEDILGMMDYFIRSKKEFLVNCIDNNYAVYENVFSSIVNVNTYTLIGVPVYNEKDIVAMFIATINNQKHDTTLLNDDDLSIMRTAIIQLHNATERIKNKADIVSINEKLNELAVTDLLTGLYNRQGMEKILNAHMESNEQVSILYIDLDNFKYYNDNFGHDTGDMLLKEFATTFRYLASGIGDVIRYGGDEFLIFLYGLEINDAKALAEKIYSSITQNIVPSVKKYVGQGVVIPSEKLITCSIGITSSHDSSISNIYTALKRADDALYTIKKTTKGNYYVLDEEI